MSITLYFFVLLFFLACRKDTVENHNYQQQLSPAQAFLRIADNADHETRLIAENLASAELKYHFISKLAEENGYPVWNKMVSSIVSDPTQSKNIERTVSTNGTGNNSYNNSGSSRGFFIIPLVDTISKEVKSYITCEKINDSAFRYHLYNKKSILNTSPLSAVQQQNIRPLLGVFASFENEINGKQSIVFKGAIDSYKFTNSHIKKGTAVDITNQTSELERRTNVIPSCKRAVLGILYIYNENSYDMIIVLSDCLTLPDVVVTGYISGGGGGGSVSSPGIFTGSIYGSPLGSIFTGSGGTGDGSTTPYTGFPEGFYGDPWSVYWASLTNSANLSASVNYLKNNLTLSDDQIVWLSQNQEIAKELATYLLSSPNANSQIAIDHIVNLMTNLSYYYFVTNYANNNPNSTVWWENDTWLDNPANINFDVDGIDDGYKKLNDQEKSLVRVYPLSAYKISKNKEEAERRASINYPGQLLNLKGDAYRHTIFSAMNQRDCGHDMMGQSIARLFGEAHESNTPAQLQLEKQMDLFNNEVGYTIGNVLIGIFLSDDDIGYAAEDKLNNGFLRYLKPLLTTTQDNNYWGANGSHDSNTATHGIYSLTVLTPTNQ